MGRTRKRDLLAKGKNAPPSVTTGRVYAIAEIMARGAWTSDMRAAMCARWGLEEVTLSRLSTEAGRLLDLLGDRERLIEWSRAKCAQWVDEGEGDRVPALRLLHDIHGLSTKRAELRPPVAPDQITAEKELREAIAMDPALRARVKGWIAEIEDRILPQAMEVLSAADQE